MHACLIRLRFHFPPIIIHHPSLIIHHSSFIIHHPSFIDHHMHFNIPCIFHPSPPLPSPHLPLPAPYRNIIRSIKRRPPTVGDCKTARGILPTLIYCRRSELLCADDVSKGCARWERGGVCCWQAIWRRCEMTYRGWAVNDCQCSGTDMRQVVSFPSTPLSL